MSDKPAIPVQLLERSELAICLPTAVLLLLTAAGVLVIAAAGKTDRLLADKFIHAPLPVPYRALVGAIPFFERQGGVGVGRSRSRMSLGKRGARMRAAAEGEPGTGVPE